MKQGKFKLLSKDKANESGKTWILKFEAPNLQTVPGQFVNIALEGKYLRRPISVSDYDSETGILTLIVDVVGGGTAELAASDPGTRFDMLTELGRGFSLNPSGKNLLLLAGGVGFAPMIGLMKALAKNGYNLMSVFGFNDRCDVPAGLIEDLKGDCEKIFAATISGNYGEKGNTLEVAKRVADAEGFAPDYLYACGPMPMMNAICRQTDIPGELSLEARMGCGFGACMGCSIKTADGIARICKEGPVFSKNQIITDNA